jgi:hypothetical protein
MEWRVPVLPELVSGPAVGQIFGTQRLYSPKTLIDSDFQSLPRVPHWVA